MGAECTGKTADQLPAEAGILRFTLAWTVTLPDRMTRDRLQGCFSERQVGDMANESRSIQEELVMMRRDLHRIPELGLDLPKTHKYVSEKLQQYGISSTGDKEKDLQKLHVKELEEAKNVEKIDSKFLTINESEHRLILSKELSKNEDKLTEISNNPTLGQEILGQQVYQAIQMKKQKFKI